MQSPLSRIQSTVTPQATVEVYDCGCKIHYSAVDYGEFEGDLPQTLVLIPEFTPCKKHAGSSYSNPPTDSRLVAVLHEKESYLNE
jgi:hypothetical protein